MLNILIFLAILALIVLLFDRIVGIVVFVALVTFVVVGHAFLLVCAVVNSGISRLTPLARRVRSFIRREARNA